MKAGWCALEFPLPEPLEECVLGVLGPDCLGAEFRPDGMGCGLFVAYFAGAGEAGATEEAVRELLGTHPLAPTDTATRLRRVEDGRWVERYQAALSPLPVGRRFLVDPTGGAPPGKRIAIALVPGRAFGTGEHPTTRLCVAALERHVRPDSRWADVGCGSGILSVVASHCGAREVLALDVDPEALEIAREVVRRNGLSGRIRCVHASHEALEPGSRDGIVANIAGACFVEGAAPLADVLAPGGRLVVSGFLDTERSAVRSAFVVAGLSELDSASERGWSVQVYGHETASGVV
jgi:ribosomal protein L11 methyltransferase